MEEARLSVARATLIANALKNDGTFAGTPEWLDAHNIKQGEYDSFIDYAQRLAQMYEWRDDHSDFPPFAECDAIVTKGNVTKKGVTLTIDVSPSALPTIQRYIDEDCVMQLYPAQMPLPMGDEEYVKVDGQGVILD